MGMKKPLALSGCSRPHEFKESGWFDRLRPGALGPMSSEAVNLSRMMHTGAPMSIPDHHLDGFCWCQPRVEEEPFGGLIYVHRESAV